MKKRKLVIDDLRVDSFATGENLPLRGTVQGFAYPTLICDSNRICGPTQVESDAQITCDFDCTVSQYTYCPQWCDPNPTNADTSPC